MQPIWSDLSILIPLWNTRIHLGWYRLSQPRVVLIKNLSNLSARPGMSIRRDWQSQAFLSKGQNPGTVPTIFSKPQESHGTQVPKNPYRSHETQESQGTRVQTCPKAGVWLCQRFLCRYCASDIFPSLKRPKRISPKSQDLSLIAHPLARPAFPIQKMHIFSRRLQLYGDHFYFTL